MKNKKFFVSLFSIVLVINMITTGCSKETNVGINYLSEYLE